MTTSAPHIPTGPFRLVYDDGETHEVVATVIYDDGSFDVVPVNADPADPVADWTVFPVEIDGGVVAVEELAA